MLDPSIILGANVNAGEVAQKTQANLQQQQAAQQQLQLQQYGVAQAKQDFEDQQNFRKAFVQANGDPDLAVSTALKLGVSPKMIQAFKQQQLAMQTAQAGLSEKQLANQQAKHDMAYPVLTRLTSLTPEQYAAQLPSTVDGLVKQGSLTPEEGTRYGSMPQDDAKLYLAQLLNAKGLAEQTTANARAGATAVSQAKLPGELQDLADKHAKSITDQTEVKRQNVVREASSAYSSAATPQDAAVAYKKVLDKYSGDQDVAGFALPSPEALAQAPNPKAGVDLINAAGMTAEQRTQAAQAAANAAREQEAQQESARHHKASEGFEASNAANTHLIAQAAMGDREISALGKPHQAALTSGQQQMEKITDARQMLDSGNAEGIALAIPKVLSALVSGQGSGVRITQPELNSIGSARGITGDVTAFMQKASSGQKLTPTQVQQLKGLLDDVGARIQKKMTIANDTINNLQNAPDRAARIKADQDGRSQLNSLETSVSKIPKGAATATGADGHKIFSTDGGNTWFDGGSGKRIQ